MRRSRVQFASLIVSAYPVPGFQAALGSAPTSHTTTPPNGLQSAQTSPAPATWPKTHGMVKFSVQLPRVTPGVGNTLTQKRSLMRDQRDSPYWPGLGPPNSLSFFPGNGLWGTPRNLMDSLTSSWAAAGEITANR